MAQAEKTPGRRMGPPGSANWLAMLDGTEDTLREEGYAALTSRRIAERVGVKQRLVYYYFHTMDDLIVETFRRLSTRELARLEAAAVSEQPLHEIWNVCINTSDARLVSEFMALANRIPALKAEVVGFIGRARALQVDALSRAMQDLPVAQALGASGLVMLATSAALSLNREAELGVREGHDEVLAAISAFLRQLEPSRPHPEPASSIAVQD
jgi:AcrR family transcriptional regulator